MEYRIAPEDVRVGMFVRGFGGSWLDHPFWFARFAVKAKHLARLQAADVPYIVIDDERGIGPTGASQAPIAPRAAEICEVRPKNTRSHGRAGGGNPGKRRIPSGSGSRARNDAKTQTRKLVARSLRIMRDTFARIRAGRTIELGTFEELVGDIVSTAGHCPRTLIETIRLKQKDEYTHLHSVAVATLMVNVARQLGRSEREVYEYGLAGLFHDIGKVRVDDAILGKEGSLSTEEFDLVRAHPQDGFDILRATPGLPDAALDVCLHHHERPDGKGYPFGLAGEALSEVARLGAICDVYDALTSDRAYKSAWSPVDAVTAMWGWDGQFDRELLFAFMHSIGVFPTGMVLALDDNRLALVLEPRSDAHRSRLLVFFSTATRSALPAVEVPIGKARGSCRITAPVDPADFGICAEDCQEANLRSADWTCATPGTLAA